jgi:hypothetical protein
MASFGTRHIINPFEKFAEYMALALHSPAAYNLLLWLTGLPGTTVTATGSRQRASGCCAATAPSAR